MFEQCFEDSTSLKTLKSSNSKPKLKETPIKIQVHSIDSAVNLEVIVSPKFAKEVKPRHNPGRQGVQKKEETQDKETTFPNFSLG